ncbi:MAG: serine--tRNA ligase, partial [Thermoprotei archaeon]
FYSKKGFNNIIIPPYLMRKSIEEKITYYEAFRDAIYHVVEGNLILITTSEHPIAAMYIDHTFREDELPLRILAWSPAFRKEAGAHGKDTKGIFRTHQFHKVELHSITRLGEDIGELEYILKITEEFMQSLNIPYRVTLLSSGDMDRRATIQYDIEGWFPGQGRYRELFSLATMGDWVSRKINTRVQRKNGKEYVANLYATGVAIQRMLCCIIENYYNIDSNLILVPEKLIKYTGFKKIEVKK